MKACNANQVKGNDSASGSCSVAIATVGIRPPEDLT